MNETEDVVKAYLEAIGKRNFELARTYLADRRFSYTSPISSFDDADRFIEQISHIGPILQRLEIRRMFSAGLETIAIVDFLIAIEGYVTHTTAILFRTENGKIRFMEAIFDASDYYRMFSE